MKDWNKKVALITDCNTALGLIIMEKFAKAGMVVIGFGLNDEIIYKARTKLRNSIKDKDKGNVVLLQCNITETEQLTSVFDHIKNMYYGVDVLVNNASCNSDCLVSNGTFEEFNEIINTNINALVACTNFVTRCLVERKVRGHIININDLQAYEVPNETKKSVYVSTKVAVTSINETLRHELRYLKANVKVTNVAFGNIEGENFEEQLSKVKDFATIIMDILDTSEHLQVHEMLVEWDPDNSVY